MTPTAFSTTKKTLAWALASTLLATTAFVGIAEACTLMGATGQATSDGNAYIASTSDNPYIEGPRNMVYLTIPKNGYKFVHTPLLIQDTPGHYFDVGSDRGMNEKGFAWTRAWVVPSEAEAPNRMPAVDWFRKLGSTVATVDEAIRFVQDNPKGIGDQGNYIFADAQGNMAAVEVGYQTVNVVGKWTKADKGIAARANRWTSDRMKPLDIGDTADEHDHEYFVSTGYRQPRAMQLLTGDAGRIDVAALKKILADNDNRDKKPLGDTGFSISNHGLTGGTVAAEVYDPAHRTFWFTYGWPDGDHKSSNPSFDGANQNTWGAWVPFVISEMTEEGFYTDWNGNMTPIGARYLSRLIAEKRSAAQD